MNILSKARLMTVETLLLRGLSQREITKITGVHRSAVKRVALSVSKRTNPSTGKSGENVPTCPPAKAGEKPFFGSKLASACEPHRDWIERQVELGRNAMSIYQDLVEMHGFPHKYVSVRRFVKALRWREPKRFDILDFPPGEEAQVDYGQGAPMIYKGTRKKKPYLFVMTLKHSGKAFRKTVWKTDQYVWAKLHEEAFRYFGCCPRFVVLDNLKEGVITPDIYEPVLNKVYAAMLNHYGVVAQPCWPRDPDRKGAVERAIQHTQDTALKGKVFATIEEQNKWLMHWEENWAATRIHGTKKRQVLEMFKEEKPHMLPLPVQGFRYYSEEERMVDHAGMVQVKGNFYAAMPAPLYRPVKVRVFMDEVVIVDNDGQVLRRHALRNGKGKYYLDDSDRIFNPTLNTAKLLDRARKIGANTGAMAEQLFATTGRTAQGTLYGLTSLIKEYSRESIEDACGKVLVMAHPNYQAVKRILKRTAPRHADAAALNNLQQTGPEIRPVSDYQRFWDLHARSNSTEEKQNGNDIDRGGESAEGTPIVRYVGHA